MAKEWTITPMGRTIGGILGTAGLLIGLYSGLPWITKGEADLRFRAHEQALARLEQEVKELNASYHDLQADHVEIRDRQNWVLEQLGRRPPPPGPRPR